MAKANALNATLSAKLAAEDVETLVVGAILRPSFRAKALAHIAADMFTAVGENSYRLLWLALRELAAAGVELTHQSIRSRVLALSATSSLACTLSDVKDLVSDPRRDGEKDRPGLLYHAFFAIEQSEISDADLDDLLRRFLHERHVVAPIRKYLAELSDQVVPDSLDLLVGDIQQRSQVVTGLTDTGRVRLLRDRTETRPILVGRSSGCPFIDVLTAGGPTGGEVVYILGPTKLGKTTMAVQLAMTTGLILARDANVRHAYLFSYEDDAIRLEIRAAAFGARIDRDRFGAAKSIADLSTSYDMQQYEREAGESCGEQERYATEMSRYERNVHLLDWTRRNGGIPEIAAFLAAERAAGRNPGCAIVDWAGELVKRNIAAAGTRDPRAEEIRQLNEFPSRLRREIAQPFDIPVYFYHQLKGSALKVASSRVGSFTHSDGAGATSMGVHSDFSIMADRDPKTDVVMLRTESVRRGIPNQHSMILLEGRFARFRQVDAEFVFTQSQGIVRRDAAQELGMVEAVRLAAPRRTRFVGNVRRGSAIDSVEGES